MYEYDAVVTNVVDGDTIDMEVVLRPQQVTDAGILMFTPQRYFDLGFRHYTVVADASRPQLFRDRFRLFGINAWEVRGKHREKGIAATEFVEDQILRFYHHVRIETHKDKRGKYGRWLATVFVGDENLNDLLVSEGHAVKVDY